MELQPKLTTLAAALRDQRDQILSNWLDTLRIGMEKPGGALTDRDLRDHFTDLLEDLCNQLEVPLTETSEISALRHAEIHGDMRWAQGYKLPELIREVAALRTVVIAVVVLHGHTHLSLVEQSLANIIVHRFFDALVVESVTFFATLAQDAALLRERQHLAQELHDSACQTIQSGLLELAMVRRKVDSATADQLGGIGRALKQGLDDVRTIVHGLVASVRKIELGLPAALEELGIELARVVPCEVRCDPAGEIPSKLAFQLFRIAQEAATNACKHGHPENLSITLTGGDGHFQLQVHDDGRGFDPSHQTSSGIGLFSMQQRARAIAGALHVESQPRAGTTITCIVPKVVPIAESST